MGKYLVIAFLITTANMQPVFAQHLAKRDSLLHALSIAKEDTNKVNTLLLLGQQFEGSIPDSAIFYYRKAGALSEKFNSRAASLQAVVSPMASECP